MSSLVLDFQRAIIEPSKTTTELLRTAKLISAKLSLSDISAWIGNELNGYGPPATLPEYRFIRGGTLMAYNPVRGWQRVGHINQPFAISQPMPSLEQLVEGKNVVLPLTGSDRYSLEGIANDFSQQVDLSTVQISAIVSAVRDRLLDWSTELESRGILGREMAFDSKEQKSAQRQVFHIQNFTGVFGDVSNSTIQIYDYSTLHQTLKENNVPQVERNDLENIMDELKKADHEKKKPLLERAKQWVTKNADFLGASVSIVRKALGIGD